MYTYNTELLPINICTYRDNDAADDDINLFEFFFNIKYEYFSHWMRSYESYLN